jgi:hypothetical protein
MPNYKLEIVETSIDGTTGHHVAHVRVIECDDEGNRTAVGVLESYGIDALALESLHSGDIDIWLAAVGREMRAKHERRMKIHHELTLKHGTTIDI